MGCTSMHLTEEEKSLQQEKIILNLNTKYHLKELNNAQSLIDLISRIRNKIIYLYHKLIYNSGACIFTNPNIIHCLYAIFYKISSEYQGNLKLANITYLEDPPYLKIPKNSTLSEISLKLLTQLFNFIIEVRSYKNIIKQIDKKTPELLYLIFERGQNLSKENIDKINKGINMFKDMVRIRYDILTSYKNEIYEYATKNHSYCKKIDVVGKEAFNNNITDIYEIVMLKKNHITEEDERDNIIINKSIADSKKSMEKIMQKEKEDEIIIKNDSIIQDQRENGS